MSTCRKCNAPVLWVTMVDTGAKMILDAKPENMVRVEGQEGEMAKVYRPHWATCPHAAEFRKKGPAGERE